MSDASIGVKIGADYQNAVAGFKAVETAATGLNNSLKSTDQTFVVTNNLLNQSVGYTKQHSAAMIQAAEAIKIVAPAAQESAQAIEKIGSSSRGILEPLNNAYNVIRKVAYALPGIGISGIFALAFEGIAAAVESFTGSAAQAEAAQKKLNETLGAGSASVQGEVSAMQDLAAIALDTANSTDLRKKAFAELQQLYPGYLGNLSLEKSSYDDIKTALDKVTEALVRQAQIKGLEEAITDTYKELNKTIADGGTTFQKVTANVASFFAALNTTGNFKGVSGLLDSAGKVFDKAKQGSIQHSLDVDTTESQHQVDALNDKLKTLLADSLKNNDALLKQKPPGNLPVVDALQEEINALTQLEELTKKAIKLPPLAEAFAQSIDPNASQLLSDKIALLIRNNTKNGIKSAITDKEVALMKDELAKLLNPDLTSKIDTRVEVNPIVEKDVNKFEAAIEPELADLLKKLPPLKTDIKVDPSLKVVADAEKAAKQLEGYKKAISGALIDVGTGIVEDVGKALSGTKNPFSGILELIGGALEDLGKQLIIVGGLAQLIQDALGTLFTNPGTAILVGALAIAAGAVLKSIGSEKGVTAFAEGGIVTGPTNALIGEAGPEVVFPLDKLNKFIRNNGSSPNMNVSGQFVLRNQDLVLAVQRGQRNQSFVS